VLKLLREIVVHLHDGSDVMSAYRKAGISDKSYHYWCKKFGGIGRSQLREMKSLQKEIDRLKKIVADLRLNEFILKDSLDHLRPVFPSHRCGHPFSLGRSSRFPVT
jgi:hypothetical protein